MFAKSWVKHSFFVAITIMSLLAGDALAKGGKGGHGGGGGGGGDGGGGRSSWSGGGGSGGGGGSSASRGSYSPPSRGSFRGGSSTSGGGGSSIQSFQRNFSSSAGQSARSFSQSGGDSGRSSWSGGGSNQSSWPGGGTNGGRSLQSQSMQFNTNRGGGDSGQSNDFRRFYSNNGGQQGGSQSDTARSLRSLQSNGQANQLRSWNTQQSQKTATRQWNGGQFYGSQGSQGGQLNSEMTRNLSRGRYSSGKPNSDELQAFFEKHNNQSSGDAQTTGAAIPRRATFGQNDEGQAAGNLGGRSNAFRRSGSGKNGPQELANQVDNANANNSSAEKVRRRGDGNRFGSNGNWSGNKNSDEALKRFANQSNLGGGRDFARRADWSKWSKDSGNIDPTTKRWYGNSGFGDHRGRTDRHDNDHDQQFANQVRNNWQNKWGKEHGRHDDDHDDHFRRGRGYYGFDDDYFPFASAWWARHNYSAFHLYWNDRRWRNDPYYWWHTCSAPVLTTWIDFGWNYPCYWDYGPGEYIYYYNDAVFVDGQRYATALEYYAQVRGLARSVPRLTPDQLASIEWLPLGVFAVSRPGAAASNEIAQLAVSKDGILSGTLFNQQTGTARPLQGMVEQATQRAAWCFADAPNDGLVIETSLYNLTESECTALAHLGPVTTEYWQLVRLEQPVQPAGPAPK